MNISNEEKSGLEEFIKSENIANFYKDITLKNLQEASFQDKLMQHIFAILDTIKDAAQKGLFAVNISKISDDEIKEMSTGYIKTLLAILRKNKFIAELVNPEEGVILISWF